MSVNVGPIELLWIATNLMAIAVTIGALIDANRDRVELKLLPAQVARMLVARGAIRRETIRLLIQTSFLLAVVPIILRDGVLALSPTIFLLLVAALLVLLQSLLDARQRHMLGVLTVAEVVREREAAFVALSRQIAQSTAASRSAERAANDTNVKIENLNERLVEQSAEMTRTDKHQDVQDKRIDRVEDQK